MIRYFASSKKIGPRQLTSGFDGEGGACEQAEYLAETYGGVATVTNSLGEIVGKYSVKRGWH